MPVRDLILIRQFYSEVRLTPAAETPFLRLKRTLHLDLCVELALNAVVRDFGNNEDHRTLGSRRDLDWFALWDLADGVSQRETGSPLPEKASLKLLHELRNLAQHRGSVPSADEVRDAVGPVRLLVEYVTRRFYELDFERLREWDVLESIPLRNVLNSCHASVLDGDTFRAAVGCSLAYDRIIECVRDAAAGGDASNFQGGGTWNTILNPVLHIIQALEAEVFAVSLGISIVDHYHFLFAKEGVRISYHPSERLLGIPTRHWPDDAEEARRKATLMVEYLGRASVLLESAFPGVLQRFSVSWTLDQLIIPDGPGP